MYPNIAVDRVNEARAEIAAYFLQGSGIEVGAGPRPFPVPRGVKIAYGDIRDAGQLTQYFSVTGTLGGDRFFDAQTMAGIKKESLDFVLSGHVIEHLWDPVGAIVNTVDVLKPGGVFILAVPDMRFTFDRDRPETSVGHVLADYRDGGAGTTKQAFVEHLRYCHPILADGEIYDEREIDRQSSISASNRAAFDLHVHAWSLRGFRETLQAAQEFSPFEIEICVPVENENIFVLRKRKKRFFWR
jgi:SAM-dependent methyltransferase